MTVIMKINKAIIIAILFLLFTISCANKPESKKINKAPVTTLHPKTIIITTSKSEVINIPKTIKVTGSFSPVKEAVLSSLTEGIVIEIPAELGDHITKDQVIAKLDNETYRLQLAKDLESLEEIKARLGISYLPNNSALKDKINIDNVPEVRQAKVTLNQAQLDLTRAEALVKEGYWPSFNLDNAKTKFEINKAAYQATKESVAALAATMNSKIASMEITKKHLRDTIIKAPFSGQVRERLVNKGEYVREGTPLISIVTLDPIKLQLDIPEQFAEKVNINNLVQVKSDAIPNKTFTGKLNRISPNVNINSRSYLAESLLPNPNNLIKPGSFASADIVIKKLTPTVVVPESSILSVAGVNKIFVIKNGTAFAHQVVLGESKAGTREVFEGVSGGEVIATSRLGQLFDGAKVTELNNKK